MKRAILAASAVVLSACSSAQLQQAQSSIAAASADLLATVNAACAEYAPVAAAMAAAKSPAVDAYLKYGNSICGSAGGAVSAGVTVDASTAAWVGAITGALEALATPPATRA